MKFSRAILTVLVLFCSLTSNAFASAKLESLSKSLGSMGVAKHGFIKNLGQWDERVLFRADAGNVAIWIARDGIYYQLIRRVGSEEQQTQILENTARRMPFPDSQLPKQEFAYEQQVVRAAFRHANEQFRVIERGELDIKYNYFIGRDPSRWHSNVPSFERVVLVGLYEGIDLSLTFDQHESLICQFMSSPGADRTKAEFEYDGATSIESNRVGQLVAITDWGNLTGIIGTPELYGAVQRDSVHLLPSESGLTSNHQTQRSLPDLESAGLVYSTYLGGSGYEEATAIAVDRLGCSYVAGNGFSFGFPGTPSAGTKPERDAGLFLVKLDATGTSVLYGTFFGGSGVDASTNIAIDEAGCAYVTGWTTSRDFPTINAYSASHNGGADDGFVTKFSEDGSMLIYSTYLGGSTPENTESDAAYGIGVDGDGCAYITGQTVSSDFPLVNPLQDTLQGREAFVSKLSASGSELEYSTYLGGWQDEVGRDVAIDDAGCAYVVGATQSSDFPVRNAFQSVLAGNEDAFIAKLSPEGSELEYSTFLGGLDRDYALGVDLDESNCPYIAGFTSSTDFPTSSAFDDEFNGASDLFVTKLDVNGELAYSTYLGGSSDDWGFGISIDKQGRAHVAGNSYSSDFPVLYWYGASNCGEFDACVAVLSASGRNLIYSTYLGGSEDEAAYGIGVDDSGYTYVAGYTASSDFPTTASIDSTFGGNWDGFVAKLTKNSQCGDANADGLVNITDAVYLVTYIFNDGPEPQPYGSGDTNCDDVVNITDAVYLIQFIFSTGAPPCDTNNDGTPDC